MNFELIFTKIRISRSTQKMSFGKIFFNLHFRGENELDVGTLVDALEVGAIANEHHLW